MSIINDALKKLQSQRQESIPIATPAADSYRNTAQETCPTEASLRETNTAAPGLSRPSRERPFSKSLFMYVLTIICGLVAFSLLKMPGSPFPETAYPAIEPQSIAPAAQSAVIKKVAKISHISENTPIAVHGIMLTGDAPAALINNEVYQVGDTVSDMSITAILEDRVILSQGSKEIVLKVNGKR